MIIEEESFRSSFFYWIGTVEKLANANFVRQMGSGKGVVARWRTLSVLAEKKATTINELADETFIERSALSRLLDVMENDGLLKRRTRADDRRTTEVSLTRKGAKMFEEMLPVRRGIFSRASAGLTKDQTIDLMKAVQQLAANLRQELEAPLPEQGPGGTARRAAGRPSAARSKLPASKSP